MGKVARYDRNSNAQKWPGKINSRLQHSRRNITINKYSPKNRAFSGITEVTGASILVLHDAVLPGFVVRPRGLPQQGIQGAFQGEDEIGPKTLTHSASPNRCHSLSEPLLLASYKIMGSGGIETSRPLCHRTLLRK